MTIDLEMSEVTEATSRFPTYNESTLRDYGHMVPIGKPDGKGGLLKSFAFYDLDWGKEEEIDRVRNAPEGPGDQPGLLTLNILAIMLKEWHGDAKFSTRNHDGKLNTLLTSCAEDVLYAWVCFRVESEDPTFEIDVEKCPSCKKKFTWSTDLRGLEIKVTDTPPEDFHYRLRKPHAWGQDRVIDTLILRPHQWSGICDINHSARRSGLTDIKRAILSSSIYGCYDSRTPDDKVSLSPLLRQRISKVDMELMSNVVEKAFPRADLTMQIVCPHCCHLQKTPLDWTWDFFFGAASLPGV